MVLTNGAHIDATKNYDYNIIKVIPYLLVLILALVGINVIIVLIGGTLLSAIIGLVDHSFWLERAIKFNIKRYCRHGRYCNYCIVNWWFSCVDST